MAEEESFPVGAVEYVTGLDLFPSEAIRLRGQPWNVGGGGEGGSDGSEEVHQLACPRDKAEAVEETVTGGIRWQAASLSGHPDGCQGGDLVSPFVDVGEGCFAARIAGEAFTDPFFGDSHACDGRDEIRVRHLGVCVRRRSDKSVITQRLVRVDLVCWLVGLRESAKAWNGVAVGVDRTPGRPRGWSCREGIGLSL